MQNRPQVVAALAGRRIDPDDAKISRFPLSEVDVVRRRIADVLLRESVTMLVCSAACGADLLALDAANSLGLRCRVVLPFEREKFRRTSVVDRPGAWGEMYDRILSSVDASGDLVVLGGVIADERSYDHANETILREAQDAARGGRSMAIMVWDGRSYGDEDATAEFGRLAAARGMSTREVMTCER